MTINPVTDPIASDFFDNKLYVGLITSIAGAIIGGLVGSLVPFLLTMFRERRTFTLSLIAQFDSIAMYNIRTRSWRLCQGLLSHRFDSDEFFNAEEADNLWVLIGFFRTISILLEQKRLNKKLTRRVFGQVFVWWYYACFETQLIPIGERWNLVHSNKYLHDWLEKHTSKKEFAMWADAGRKARAKVLAGLQPSQTGHKTTDAGDNAAANSTPG